MTLFKHSEENQLHTSCKDHVVSQEKFSLYKDVKYDLLYTHPQPSLEKLASYYESEDYISHTDAKKTLLDRIYQWVKSYSLFKKEQLLASYFPNKGKLLDIGAGTASFLQYCKQKGWQVDGVEPSTIARNHANTKGIALHSTTDELQAAHQYDVITLWHVLEHLPDLDDQIQKMKNLLSENGILIIAVPNYKSYDATYYGPYWAAYDVPRHLWHFSQTAISRIFNEKGMSIIQTVPMKFDSYYVSLLSEKYKNATSNFLNAFLVGFRSNSKAKANKEYSSLIYVLKNTKNKQ